MFDIPAGHDGWVIGDGVIALSGTTYELLAGSSLEFDDLGEHELRGISGRRRVYALAGDARQGRAPARSPGGRAS